MVQPAFAYLSAEAAAGSKAAEISPATSRRWSDDHWRARAARYV